MVCSTAVVALVVVSGVVVVPGVAFIADVVAFVVAVKCVDAFLVVAAVEGEKFHQG